MNEKNKKELHTAILTGLKSKESKVVIDSINQLREEGKPEDIAILLDMLLVNHDEEIQHTILKFLADIKDKKAGQIFMDAIANEKYKGIRKNLVGICWESSIDFTDYVPTFIDLLIESDFETSFEAFTVIENLTGVIPEDVKEKEKSKLKEAIADAAENRKGMLHEAIHIIDQI